MIDRRVLPDGRPVWIRTLTFNIVLDAEFMPDEMDADEIRNVPKRNREH